MANLVRARSWGQVKPPPGSQIDWGHPLSQGLVFCALLNESGGQPIDIVSGQAGTVTNAPAPNRMAHQGYEFVAASTQRISWSPTGALWNRAYSGFSVAASLTRPSGNNYAVARDGSARIFSLRAEDAQWFTSAGLTRADASQFARAQSATVPVQVVGSWQTGQGVTRYSDGLVDPPAPGSNPGSPVTGTMSASATEPLYIGFRAIGGEYFTGTVGWVYIWGRGLTPDEVFWLNAEPYTFIAPPGPKVLYFGLGSPADLAIPQLRPIPQYAVHRM